MTVVLLVFRIVATLVLIPILAGFIGMYSIIQEVNSDNYESILDQATEQILIIQANPSSNGSGNLNLNASHTALISSCSGQNDTVLEGINITISCSDIIGTSTSGLDELIRINLENYFLEEFDKRSAQIGAEYVGLEYDGLEFYFETINITVLILGFSTVAMVVIIIFLSFPKYQLATYLGLGGLIAGLPALIIEKTDLSYLHGNIPVLSVLIENILLNLYQNYLVILLSGFAMVAVGIIWTITTRFGIISMRKKSSKKDLNVIPTYQKRRITKAKPRIEKEEDIEIEDIKEEKKKDEVEGLPDLNI